MDTRKVQSLAHGVRRHWFFLAVIVLVVVALLGIGSGCSDEEADVERADVGEDADTAGESVGPQDVSDGDAQGSDTSTPHDTDSDSEGDDGGTVEPSQLTAVDIDFDASFDAAGDGFVRAAQVESEDDIIPGEVSQGVEGDWVLENDHGRYLVGLGNRVIGPCSWDGNVIDAEPFDQDGDSPGSVLGEICLLLNIGQTMRPQWAEVVEDGSDGRAVVAVTGEVGPLDFLNLRSMLTEMAPGLYDFIHLDPDRSPPLTITVYYVLTPDSRSLRVLTAFRNDGEDTEYFNATHLVLSGSTGSFFNPLSTRKGWGYNSLGVDNLEADPTSFVGYFAPHAGYAVVPDPVDHLEAELPAGGGMVAISGVVGIIHGATDLLRLLGATDAQLPNTDGYIGIEPGEVDTVGYRLYPADGSVSSASDIIFSDLGVETSTVRGRVVDAQGEPLSDVQVTPLKEGDRAFTMSRSDEDGQFSMNLPHGEWEIRARNEGQLTQLFDVETSGADVELGEIALQDPAEVEVRVRTPDGEPVPARIVVACSDACGERRPTSRERDQTFVAPRGWLQIVEVGIDGNATLRLFEGEYRISVNRGMTWTTWPQDAVDTGGTLIDVSAGDQEQLDVEIAEVVDTSGMLSADFHIHAMASPDSSTGDRERVRDFLAGGLDVMVSSDHDAVVDFQPTIDALGVGDHITSVVGNEITAANLGHINAFPLEYDPQARRGGPLDWSGDGGYHLTLQELADATRSNPGEQVIQLNHPRAPAGTIGVLQADVLTGQSFADPDLLRMSDANVDEETGDTGLWSDDFDAIEVYNGFSMNNFWDSFRWWLTMVGRGFSPTATAVTDTHGIYGSLGASPRSFVLVDEDSDTPATMDLENFVAQIRSGALLGTSGPMMHVLLRNHDDEGATMGQTLDVSGGTATAQITLEMPEWIDVDTLDVYVNIPADELQGEPGESITDPVEPTQRIQVEWEDEHRELVAEGNYEHHRLRQTVEIELEVESDSYVVFLARGLNGRDMLPVVSNSGQPLAFSNPVFLDADGGGYDTPPLMQARLQQLAITASERGLDGSPSRAIIETADDVTEENLGRLLEELQCEHGFTADDGHHHDHGSHGHDHGSHTHGDDGAHHHGPNGHHH